MENIFKIDYKKLKKMAQNKQEKLRRNHTKLIMGLDISSKSTGIAIITENNELKFMDKLYIPNYNKTDEQTKMFVFAIGLTSVIKKYNPCIAIVEDVFSRNISTHRSLSEFHGLCKYLLALNDIPIKYIHPSSAKSFIGCKDKEEVFNKMIKMYNLKNLKFEDANDGVDALLIALNHKNKEKLK